MGFLKFYFIFFRSQHIRLFWWDIKEKFCDSIYYEHHRYIHVYQFWATTQNYQFILTYICQIAINKNIRTLLRFIYKIKHSQQASSQNYKIRNNGFIKFRAQLINLLGDKLQCCLHQRIGHHPIHRCCSLLTDQYSGQSGHRVDIYLLVPTHYTPVLTINQ